MIQRGNMLGVFPGTCEKCVQRIAPFRAERTESIRIRRGRSGRWTHGEGSLYRCRIEVFPAAVHSSFQETDTAGPLYKRQMIKIVR